MSEHSKTRQELIEEISALKEKISELQRQAVKQKLTEEALRQSKALNRSILQVIPEIIIQVNAQGDYLDIQTASEESLILPRKQLVHKNIRDLFPENEFVRFLASIKKAIDTNTLQTIQYDIDLPAGKHFFEARIVPSGEGEALALIRNITEHKEAEDLMGLQSLVLDQIQDLVTITDLDGVITYVNQAEVDLLGYDREQLIGFPIRKYGEDPEKGASQQQILEETLRNGSWRGEIVNQTDSGEDKMMDCRTQVIHDDKGQAVALCGIATDITERKLAENRLRKSERRLRQIIEFLPDATFVIDTEGRVTAWNNAMQALTGIRASKIRGKGGYLYAVPFYGKPRPILIDLVITQDKEVALSYPSFYREEDRLFSEVYLPDFMGRPGPTWLWATASPLYDPDGQIVGAIESIRDITNRKQAEEAIRRRLDYEKAVSQISIWAMEANNLSEFLNACLDLLGCTVDVSRTYIFEYQHETDTMNNTVEWTAAGVSPQKENLQGVPGSSVPWWLEMMKSGQAIRFMDIEDIPDIKAKQVLRPQGILSILVIPLFVGKLYYGFMGFDECRRHREWAQDDVDLLFTMARIITGVIERKQAEEESEKLQAQLAHAHKMESLGQLAGGVAHDFNNMLSVIVGQAEIAMMQTDGENPIYPRLQEMREAARHSAGLVKQLLAFARKQTVAPKVLDLNKTVENMVNMLQKLIGENINLTCHQSADLWSVKIDPFQVNQILTNLCSNARDAVSDVGEIAIETKNVRLGENHYSDRPEIVSGEYVLLAVSDNGCGIDKECLEKVFDPFFTTKEAGKGTGLGLATAYGIVKQNNGFIYLQSEPGRGTTVKIYLPRHREDDSQSQQVRPHELVPGGTETVLLVEDETIVLNIGKEMLENLGYEVLTASAPNEALKIASERKTSIDLLITDVIMPEMNGRELADTMAASCPDLKCLFTSGYTADVIAHHGVLEPGINFIQKPFSMNGLAKSVRKALEG